jgi:hypothetical protein
MVFRGTRYIDMFEIFPTLRVPRPPRREALGGNIKKRADPGKNMLASEARERVSAAQSEAPSRRQALVDAVRALKAEPEETRAKKVGPWKYAVFDQQVSSVFTSHLEVSLSQSRPD